MASDALVRPSSRSTQGSPIVLGTLRLNDERGLCATREPSLSDLAMHSKRHKQMVETLRELCAPIVTEDFRSLSGNYCISQELLIEWFLHKTFF
jgi:hypothetical protein